MPISEDEFLQLKASFEDLTKAVRDLSSTYQKTAQGARTDQPAQAAAAGTGAATAAGGSNQNGPTPAGAFAAVAGAAAKLSPTVGSGLTGIGSNLASSFAQGGPAGLAAGAAQSALGVLKDTSMPAQAALDAYRNAPLFSGSDDLRARMAAAKSQAGIDLQSKYGFEYGSGRLMLESFNPWSDKPTSNDRVKRFQQEVEARRQTISGRTSDQVGGFVGDIAAAGGEVSDEKQAELIRIVMRQNQRRFDAQTSVKIITDHIMATDVGGHAALQKQ